MTFVEFWHGAPSLSRVALVTAAVATVAHLGTYGGLPLLGIAALIVLVHLAVMTQGFVLMFRLSHLHRLVVRSGGWDPLTPRRPWCFSLLLASVVALLNVLVLFVWLFSAFPLDTAALAPSLRGAHERGALRVFSAGLLAVGFVIALSAERVTARLRALRADDSQRLPN